MAVFVFFSTQLWLMQPQSIQNSSLLQIQPVLPLRQTAQTQWKRSLDSWRNNP